MSCCVRAAKLLGVFLLLAGCESSSGNALPSPTKDAGTGTNPDGAAANPCPEPAALTPSDIPAGYLPLVTVTLNHFIDGDSSDFDFPNATKQGVRMLYVNTEESGGDEKTPFGLKTKEVVGEWMRAATRIEIAVRESAPGSGKPDADTYKRWLALVFLDGELLQGRLTREGYSAYYTQFGCAAAPLHSALLLGEAKARHFGLGIWSSAEEHNDYRVVLPQWIGRDTCRPNPFRDESYCP